ncbi:MAG: flagellar protein FlaG [Firmicutes bacterium]|nr:flagellar protein FlaG [Bacillota bacterium]
MEISGVSRSNTVKNNNDFRNENLINVKEKVKKEKSKGNVIDEIKQSNEKLILDNRRLEFSVHEKTKDIMIKVIDSDTDEIIREIPPEKILDMVADFMEKAGLLVDKRA